MEAIKQLRMDLLNKTNNEYNERESIKAAFSIVANEHNKQIDMSLQSLLNAFDNKTNQGLPAKHALWQVINDIAINAYQTTKTRQLEAA